MGTGSHRRVAGILAGCACVATAVATAGPLPASRPGSRTTTVVATIVPSWDCWIDGAESGGIRCIADRDAPAAYPEDFTDDDEAAEVLLDLVHGHLHRGMAQRAGELAREKGGLLRPGDLWTIRLSAPPLETSWGDGRLELLVRTLLCRGLRACAVRFHR